MNGITFIELWLLLRTNRIFKDAGLYTIVTPSTSSLPTPLERGYWIYPGSTFCSNITSAVAKYASLCAFVHFNISSIGLACKIVPSSSHFVSRRFQYYRSLFIIVFSLLFSIPCVPNREKNIPYSIDRFHHPHTWVELIPWLTELVVLSYAQLPL
jgi:hypothetical protein